MKIISNNLVRFVVGASNNLERSGQPHQPQKSLKIKY